MMNSYYLKGSPKREIHPIEGIPTGRQISMIRFYSADFSGGSEWVKPTRSRP
jgi:hypothetical protein